MAMPTATSPRNNPSHAMLHNAYVNVKAFSAVGDGVADDTTPIQNAINAAVAGARHVFFPQGNYKITSGLTIGGHVRLSGVMGSDQANDASRITGTIATSLITRAYDGSGAIYTVIIEDLALQNFHTSGACLTLSSLGAPSGIYRCHISTSFNGIVFGTNVFSANVHATDVNGTGNVGTGITITNHTSVVGCDVGGFDVGISGGGLGTSIVGGRLEVNKTGISAGGTSGFSGTISGLYFEANDTAIVLNGVKSTLVSGINIYGTTNAPSGSSDYGIQVGDCYALTVCNISENGGFDQAFVRVYNNPIQLTLMNINSATAWVYDTFNAEIQVINCSVTDVIRAPVIATASLPAAAAAQDGRVVIEDGGLGDRNLILYAGGQRFRIDGGAAI